MRLGFVLGVHDVLGSRCPVFARDGLCFVRLVFVGRICGGLCPVFPVFVRGVRGGLCPMCPGSVRDVRSGLCTLYPGFVRRVRDGLRTVFPVVRGRLGVVCQGFLPGARNVLRQPGLEGLDAAGLLGQFVGLLQGHVFGQQTAFFHVGPLFAVARFDQA